MTNKLLRIAQTLEGKWRQDLDAITSDTVSNALADDKVLLDQTYSDSHGEYKVTDIINWAKNNVPLVTFKVDKLAKTSFQKSSEESGDEIPDSPEYIARAMKTDLAYLIIVIRYPDGDFIADGNHRLWKARKLGQKTIKGFLMQEKDLKNITKIEE